MAERTLTDRLFSDDGDRSVVDPFALFEDWFALARETEPNDPHAMALASVDPDGLPDVRMVLLNARDERGFCFFTNFESEKGRQLLARPAAAFVMHWKSQRRQVRVRGPVEEVSTAEADAYFATRHRNSQLGAHASDQSRPLERREVLADRVARLEASLEGSPVPRPPHWSGFRIVPVQIEFWKDGEFRLHDRVRFTRPAPGAPWEALRLFP
ncbi:pyridoxamine 5'-phosphate oxidase [Arsenicitalea aurantiaca]|uniref:Pyridoxine/pyridoxamine 5'-phosphate oxidase n=1 Tax=Arsenicitalea aurantiaca TaxID=1783274 RepID=A0A433XAK5_9HYPH|nr:pyridoxamine 5'-phosphate oxidase [Arsenicitalea aurantiaca]RUT31109.1 pyridoxamine 5'-phosphate oxidase [Arsenicitalea aurantiaca]